MGWHPISTAPQEDGKRILVWVPDGEGDGDVVIAEWNTFYEPPGWFCCEDQGPVSWGFVPEASHWMPLPDAPSP